VLVNLHSHLEGRVRPDTASELARAAGLPEPTDGWAAALRLDGPGDLTRYLEKVAASYPLFGRLAAIERMAREAVEDAASAGGDYLELRFGPATHARDERELIEVIRAAARGMRTASNVTAMPSGLVVAALRHHDEEVNSAVARSAAQLAGDGVVGFDLAGDELLYPSLEPYRDAFAIARAAGLGLTCHAAEAAGAWAARAAVESLGASRIGHGAHLIDDPETMAWAADAGVVVEICPTSNWYTGAISEVAAHPGPRFRDAGMRVVLGDDNPLQTGADLAHERDVLVEVLGWTPDALRELDRVSIDAAFLTSGERDSLLDRFAAEDGSSRSTR
jgi:adenosine deaminase